MSDRESTGALYYRTPPPAAFTASVVAIDRAEAHIDLVLDRTAFYPEGGGQPSDVGTIAGARVAHVRKDDGVIRHRIEPTFAAGVGESVECAVDVGYRWDYQQQHTGQHVLSAALLKAAGCNTVSVHQGADYTTIEVDHAQVDPEALVAAEDAANDAILADLPVRALWVDESEIGSYPLRRPPKVSGSIRLVQIGDWDCVACGGLHLERTGQVRLIRISRTESIRGNTRITALIGDRALRDYRQCGTIVDEARQMLSALAHEVPARIEQLLDRVSRAEAERDRHESAVQALTADRLLAQAPRCAGVAIITALRFGESAGFLRGLTERLIEARSANAQPTAVCLVSIDGERLLWSIGVSPEAGVSFGAAKESLLVHIEGKGGGKPPIWQGVGTRVSGVDAFLSAFRVAVEKGIL